MAIRALDRERGERCRVWKLEQAVVGLAASSVSVVLNEDFPASAARIEVPKELCLRYPHVEVDGHFCHGVQPRPEDFDKPVEAVGRVLARLDDFLTLCQDEGWVEAEFHRERRDYWSRHAVKATASGRRPRMDLLLDVDVNAGPSQELAAVLLGQGSKALATSASGEPEKVAALHGWAVGTLVRGGCLVVNMPEAERWTPSTWPRTFDELESLLSGITGVEGRLSNWYGSRRWPNKAPVMVALVQGPAVYGWRLLPASLPKLMSPSLLPIAVKRIDRQWSLSRDHRADALLALSGKRVAVLGCGSLGSQVIQLLARAGVGQLDVVDPQTFEAENVSRHLLGLKSVGAGKAVAVCARIQRDVPGTKLRPAGVTAAHWLAGLQPDEEFDLVVDCSGERSVRLALSKLRTTLLKAAPVLMAWMEPECAAAHIVAVIGQSAWPSSDPAETSVNAAIWPNSVQVDLAGCGEGFHPYGMADAARAAGLTSERALAILAGNCPTSGVWSMVRNRRYFEAVAAGLEYNFEPPDDRYTEAVTVVRELPTWTS